MGQRNQPSDSSRGLELGPQHQSSFHPGFLPLRLVPPEHRAREARPGPGQVEVGGSGLAWWQRLGNP